MRHAELNAEQKEALAEVIRRAPFRWRETIRKIWGRGGADATGKDGELVRRLYTLRNTHGPSWLKNVKVSS